MTVARSLLNSVGNFKVKRVYMDSVIKPRYTKHMISPTQCSIVHEYDVLVIGAGGAGLRAAIEAARHGVRVGIISKVPATRSHTVAAQGGINAALGNVTADDWRWHAYDTIRGSDWLGDQDTIRYMCRHAPEAIRDLEEMGVPFTRDASGNIYQRPYGGMSTHYGKGDLAFRACAAADRTGDAMMTGLYDYIQRYPVDFFEEYIVLDLLMDTVTGACIGCVAWELATGTLHQFRAGHTILATGGYGQIYASATSSSTCTGDGNAFALRAGIPLQDMEFIQFHPTGLYGSGVLISEAARSEGGILRNASGDAFMERYAPHYKDLASRDVVARAMMQEITEGRGCGKNKDHVMLDLTAIRESTFSELLPGTRSLAWQLLGIDVSTTPIPVIPTAHYTMGGIPANLDGQVIRKDGQSVPGLYCIGEAACSSVHGANRLGCNSLLDLIVFGKRTGEMAAQHSESGSLQIDETHTNLASILKRFDRWRYADGNTDPYEFCQASQELTQRYAGILRHGDALLEGIEKLEALWHEFHAHCGIHHRDLRWNNGLVTALETENLILQSLATLYAALYRTESRGAHMRTDYPDRNDDDWLCHTLIHMNHEGSFSCDSQTVRIVPSEGEEALLPESRTY